MRRSEQGSVAPLVAVLVLVAGLLVVGLGRLGEGAADRARARTAADAAALAGAAEGEAAARALARANGGRLVGYDVDGAEVEVEVRLGRSRAVARARRAGFGHPPPAEPAEMTKPERPGYR